jgi:hypothetical protein
VLYENAARQLAEENVLFLLLEMSTKSSSIGAKLIMAFKPAAKQLQ